MIRSPDSYRKLTRAAADAAELEVERWALQEVLDRMRADVRVLQDRGEEIERECHDLESKLAAEQEHDRQIAEELARLERQGAAVRRESAAATRRLDALAHEAAALERALCDEQRAVSSARSDLDGAIQRVTRLDFRVRTSSVSTRAARR